MAAKRRLAPTARNARLAGEFDAFAPGTLVAEGHGMNDQRRRSEAGGISLEYLLVAAFAGVIVIIAVAPILGPAIVDEYTARRAVLYSTFP